MLKIVLNIHTFYPRYTSMIILILVHLFYTLLFRTNIQHIPFSLDMLIPSYFQYDVLCILLQLRQLDPLHWFENLKWNNQIYIHIRISLEVYFIIFFLYCGNFASSSCCPHLWYWCGYIILYMLYKLWQKLSTS